MELFSIRIQRTFQLVSTYSFIRYFSYANVRIKTEIKKQTRNKNVPKKNQLTENSENN